MLSERWCTVCMYEIIALFLELQSHCGILGFFYYLCQISNPRKFQLLWQRTCCWMTQVVRWLTLSSPAKVIKKNQAKRCNQGWTYKKSMSNTIFVEILKFFTKLHKIKSQIFLVLQLQKIWKCDPVFPTRGRSSMASLENGKVRHFVQPTVLLPIQLGAKSDVTHKNHRSNYDIDRFLFQQKFQICETFIIKMTVKSIKSN